MISEVALALALVTTAGLMVKSLLRLQAQDLGVTRAPVLTFGVGVPPFVANGNEAVSRFQLEFLEQGARAAGRDARRARSACCRSPPPAINGPVRRIDQTGDNEGVPVTEFRIVMDRYFETMGVPMVAGRALDERDRQGTPFVAVVNETLAQRLFPEPRSAGGARTADSRLRRHGRHEIVGVAANVRSRRPEMAPDPEVYVPFAQSPSPEHELRGPRAGRSGGA